MVELTDPPVLEHGFVQGRFVTAVADSLDDDDRYPDLRGISGNVRFTAAQPVNLVSAGTPATVVQQPVVLPLNADGWLVDAHSEDDPARTPGVWLAVGRYTVQTIFPSATPVPQFSIEVTAEHTKESPLNLTLAAPIILPPRAVEVTRLIDRQLAQEAAGEAQRHAESADESRGYAAGFAATAERAAGAAQLARDETVALGIEVDTTAGTKVSVGGHVVSYDSGWRFVNQLFDPEVYDGGSFLIRRTLHQVHIYAPDFYVLNSGALWTVPNGFRQRAGWIRVGGIHNHTPGPWMGNLQITDQGELSFAQWFRQSLTNRTRLGVELVYNARDDLPTSLPGEPA